MSTSVVAHEPSFKEFLKDLAARQGGPEVRARRDEWVAAVERLLATLEDWLRESDTERVLEVGRYGVEREEAGLGRYVVPALRVSVGKVRADVVPGGRNIRLVPANLAFVVHMNEKIELLPSHLGGSVEIGNNYTRWQLYRLIHGSGDSWWATQQGASRNRDRVLRLDRREAFEAVLQDVLS